MLRGSNLLNLSADCFCYLSTDLLNEKVRNLTRNRRKPAIEAIILLSEKTDKLRVLIDDYFYLTKTVLPLMARSGKHDWPVREDHCFQRIVLDNVCGGVWYEHLNRPAYRHLTIGQAKRAVEICQKIVDGRADLKQLNQQSLIWRGKPLNPC